MTEPNLLAHSDLLAALYRGAQEEPPWQGFVECLRGCLGAKTVALTLHHRGQQGDDTYVIANAPGDNTDWQQVEQQYRQHFMGFDPLPLATMAAGQVVVMAATKHSDSRYQQFLEQLDIAYSLRAHCVSDGGSGDGASASKSGSQLQCWLDATRGAQAQPFGAQEQALVQALLPHLANALGSYAHMQRLAAETTLYREMIEHMALGCVLLNQQARVLAHNRVAAEVMAASPAICVRAQRLQLSNPEQQAALNGAVAAALSRAQTSNPVEQNLTPKEQAPANTALIRLGDDAGQPLSLAVHPMHVSPYAQGDSLPYVAVYLLDVNNPAPALSANREHSRQQLMKLLGLTEREATLALYLAGGDSIASAASQMHIAVATARNYSKNIYAKLGVASQSDLVRLVLASISALK